MGRSWNPPPGARDNTLNVYLKTDTSVHYRKGMSLFLVDNDMPGVEAAQARHAGSALRRHLRAVSSQM